MKELVVISGKGGTGKTSIVAAFATLADNAVLADCDVDAADLHLILDPTVIRREAFSGGSRARIETERCTDCGKCAELCRFGAITQNGASNGHEGKTFVVDPIACDGCGVCAWFCPEKAIAFGPAENGTWFISDTRRGPMVHAELGVAEENSGKLVSLVRTQAKKIAEEQKLDLIVIDGSPGIGCPVIASITGADLVLVVTEPTMSGLHDLDRVFRLTRHFQIRTAVCINKYDLNVAMTEVIERQCTDNGMQVVGRVPYTREITDAMIAGQSIVEYSQSQIVDDIVQLWDKAYDSLNIKRR